MADLSTGADSVGGERFGNCEYNDLKNHWRMSDPCANLAGIQPGMIVSDEDDDKLYHYQTAACFEIVQGDTAITDGVAIIWGDTPVAGDASIHYDEVTNDALIFGIPVTGKRKVIVCDQADIAADFTGLLGTGADVAIYLVDADVDTSMAIGYNADDQPGVWATRTFHIQHHAGNDAAFFAGAAAAENPLVYIYGYITAGAAARYGSLQVEDTNDEFVIAAENNANIEGVTILLNEANQRFRIRGGVGAQIMDDLLWIWGTDDDASIEYCEATNDAWIFGVPVDPKRGLIFCDRADVAVDFTGLIDASSQVQLHIVDLDNDSSLDWGFWADDIGLLTVPANPLRENIIKNNDYGTWSQSDANKGLATLVYDNLAGGNFGVGNTITGATSGAVGKLQTDNGATSMVLGAVSGTFQDNEQIGNGAGVTADVNGDNSIGVTNDPMNNDSTGEWTDDGVNIALAFAAAEYTVTTNAANQRAWMTNCAFSAGHLYKIELDIKDGTQAGVDIEAYFDDGAAQYGKTETTAAGWASIWFTFEAATTTAVGLAGFRVVDNCGGNNIEIRRFSVYEINPCCTAADALGPDNWVKDTTLDLYREHAGTNTFDGMFYALMMVPTTANDFVYWPRGYYDNEEWYRQFRGIPLTFALKGNTNTASHLRIAIEDSVGTTYSSYHAGDGVEDWLEVTRVINAAATSVRFLIYCDQVGTVNGNTICYVGCDIAVLGASIGEGNYRPKQQEVIWLEKTIPSNTLHSLLSQSTCAMTDLNIEADSDAILPKGCKTVGVVSAVIDSASVNNVCSLILRADAVQAYQYFNSCDGLANDNRSRVFGFQKCDVDGDMDYAIDASGANTFDITYFHYYAVQIN